jgi:hypothetical protein
MSNGGVGRARIRDRYATADLRQQREFVEAPREARETDAKGNFPPPLSHAFSAPTGLSESGTGEIRHVCQRNSSNVIVIERD